MQSAVDVAVHTPAHVSQVPDGFMRIRWPKVSAEPHSLVGLRIEHPFAPSERYVREGYQSWTVPTMQRLGDGVSRPSSPPPAWVGRRHWLQCPPYSADESYYAWRSETATAFSDGLCVWVAQADALVLVREQSADGAHPDVRFTPRQADAQEIATLLPSPPPARPHTGWTTWDSYSAAVTGEDIFAELGTAQRMPGVDVFNIDDGWQAAIGDWSPKDKSMASALARVADERKLSLWWAPFVAAPDSELVRRRPQWLARHSDGRPEVVVEHALWSAYALDLTNPDVLAHLTQSALQLQTLGATILKSDFLFAAQAVADVAGASGQLHDVTQTFDVIYRRALSALRVPGMELIACGAPLWPSLGLVEAMRVGPDVGRLWTPRSQDGIEVEFLGGNLANSWEAARQRQWMHGRAWLNDPDSVFLDEYGLHPVWASAWLDWVSRRGLTMLIGDPLGKLDAQERRRWETALEHWRASQSAA